MENANGEHDVTYDIYVAILNIKVRDKRANANICSVIRPKDLLRKKRSSMPTQPWADLDELVFAF
jgi:hypothetical protein